MDQEITNQKELVQFLASIDQSHLVADIDKFTIEEVTAFIHQVNTLNKNYPGGITEYANRARKLLADSSEDVNPFADYTPHIPEGESVDFYSNEIHKLEDTGVKEIQDTCFVLVAGGLGERLGYDGIKVALPIELTTQKTFLEYYCQYILALQTKHSTRTLPFAIMTSDDTHTLTLSLLETHSYFGLKREQVSLIKQEKVPAMIDIKAHFARVSGKLLIDTKPHGHGDIHTLLFMSGLAEKWHAENRKWLFIFQDTNALAFRILPAFLGVSKHRGFQLNSVVVPRKPGEMVGAICELSKNDGSKITINVEYNQLDALMKTVGGEPVDKDGFSKYPGNINCLLFSLPEYVAVLKETKGLIAEFINPKYTDATKTSFKSASRLECMMQDYPKLLKPECKVGFTQFDRRFCFSACKNDLATAQTKQKQNLATECAGSCEGDFYWLNSELLRICGADIAHFDEKVVYNELQLSFGPRIVLHPSFGVTLKELKSRFEGLTISGQSTVVLGGECFLKDMEIDGTLVLFGNSIFGNVKVTDKKYRLFVPLEEGQHPGFLKIRGYRLA